MVLVEVEFLKDTEFRGHRFTKGEKAEMNRSDAYLLVEHNNLKFLVDEAQTLKQVLQKATKTKKQ